MSQLSKLMERRGASFNIFTAIGVAFALINSIKEAMADDGKIDGDEAIDIVKSVFQSLTGVGVNELGIKINMD